MTTLYFQDTGYIAAQVSKAAAELAILRNPGRFFYFEEEDENILEYLDKDFLKVGGTD